MPKTTKVRRYPLSGEAKFTLLIASIINLIVLVLVAYYYPALPNVVATHYGISGSPNSYGYKSTLLIVPGIFLAVFFFFLLILHFRYVLLEKHPYLLNLPSFVYLLGEKSPALQGEIMNRVFAVYSLSAFFISLLNLIITTAILEQRTRFLLPALLIVIAVFIATVLALYRSIYRSFADR